MKVPQIYVGHEDIRIQQAFDKVRRILESIPVSGGSASGDLTGAYPGPMTVVGLQGNPVSNIPPIPGQVLGWNGTDWVPVAGATAIGSSTFIRLVLDGSVGPSVVTSLTNIPVGSTLIRSVVHIYQPFNGGATIKIETNSLPPFIIQSIIDNNTSVINVYEVEPWEEIDITNSGNIVCTVSGAPTQGKAVILIEFVSNPVG